MLKSRWLPWLLVLVLITGAGYFARTNRKTQETLRKRTETLERELAQTEWSLKQERNKVKTREERKPDGTVIIEREVNTERSSNQAKQVQIKTVVKKEIVYRDKVVEVTVPAPSPRYSVSLGLAAPISWSIPMPDYALGGSYRLVGPWFLETQINFNSVTFIPNRLSLGIRWEF